MDTPIEEQKPFENVTSTITISEVDITVPNMLSLNKIDFVSLLVLVRASYKMPVSSYVVFSASPGG